MDGPTEERTHAGWIVQEASARTLIRGRLGRSGSWRLLLLVALPGCLGPRSLELTRLRYDQAVYETSEQQWLRNIVRLRYGDLPSFLDVSAITSQFELASRGSFTGGQERDSANASAFGDLSLQFRDAPTLSYTPRDPSEIARVMTAPIGITALGLMANTGWDVEQVLRLMVAEANGLENAPGAERIVPRTVPPPTPFVEMAHAAETLHSRRAVRLESVETPRVVSPELARDRVSGSDLVQAASHDLQFRPTAGTAGLVLTRGESGYRLTFSPSSTQMVEADQVRQLLRLSPGRFEYPVRRERVLGGIELLPLPESLDEIDVRTRTLLEMLTVLSKGVQVPEEHVTRGLAAQTVGPDGILFDWTCVTRGLFHICSQRKRPKDADVAIEYRGYWYYIPAQDKQSKSTLALLQALFNLQLSEPKKAGPLLTLPVGF